MIIARCRICRYEWTPRKELPKQCPHCKRYGWNVDKFNPAKDKKIVKKSDEKINDNNSMNSKEDNK